MDWDYDSTLLTLEAYLDLKFGIRSDSRKVAQGLARFLGREETAVERAIQIFGAAGCDPHPVARNGWTASELAKQVWRECGDRRRELRAACHEIRARQR